MRICRNCGFFTEKENVYTCPDCQNSTSKANKEELRAIKNRKEEIEKKSERFCLVDMKSTDDNMRPSRLAYILAVIYSAAALTLDTIFIANVISCSPDLPELIIFILFSLLLSALPLVLLLRPNFAAWFIYVFSDWRYGAGTKNPDSYSVSEYQYRMIIPATIIYILYIAIIIVKCILT